MKIGEQLKKFRAQNELTQEDVANKLHVSRATISSWETGRTFPDIEKLIYLSELYEVSLGELVKGDPVIMENIKKDKKSLSYWKITKNIMLFLSILVLLYSVYWIVIVEGRNKRIDKWDQIGDSTAYVLKTEDTMFNARKVKIPIPLLGEMTWVQGGYLKNGVTTMINGRNGEYITVSFSDDVLKKEKVTEPDLFYEIALTEDLAFKEVVGLEYLENNEPERLELVREESKKLVSTYQKEIEKSYKLTKAQWQEINNKK